MANQFKRPQASVEVLDFPGMYSDADPNDLPPGAMQVQVNAQSTVMGELNLRPGYREVSFES
jgi:hypothetical protein